MINLKDIKDFSIDLARKTKGILPEAKGGTGQSKIADETEDFIGCEKILINTLDICV